MYTVHFLQKVGETKTSLVLSTFEILDLILNSYLKRRVTEESCELHRSEEFARSTVRKDDQNKQNTQNKETINLHTIIIICMY